MDQQETKVLRDYRVQHVDGILDIQADRLEYTHDGALAMFQDNILIACFAVGAWSYVRLV